ncbi:uncharacterized protein FIBRA_02617 [Fibroporia radiculosa]|uniref:Mediator of RNA polymerase II transcription subunit 1 n=1 Tax=Fibroporia radiculosa TaxID=599839 RepID=J4I957_9APHY|nr:uncharacterized protein FIBRA_02617 [Fibroporia radiculosa]CCM00581.1 predicted protein [Fibroporia radiculosa]
MMHCKTKAQELNGALRAAIAAKNPAELTRLLKSIREDLQWAYVFNEAVILAETVMLVGEAFPSDEGIRTLVEMVKKTLTSMILPLEKISQEWWTEPAQPASPSITLIFRDTTSSFQPLRVNDNWDTIPVETNLDEDFRIAFLRFRVRANKRHRHPLLPSLDFDIVVPSQVLEGVASESETTLLSSENAGKHSVRSMLDQLKLDTARVEFTISYVRSDHRNILSKKTPAQSTPPWRRLLPDWFITTPSSWISPIPPSAFSTSVSDTPEPTTPAYKFTNYYPVPLLKYTGTGKDILPDISSPPIVASHIYVPLDTHVSPYGTNTLLAGELSNDLAQLVPDEDRLPFPLADEQAQSLLGRVVQYSIVPLQSHTERPKKKARSQVLTEFVTAVWGYDPSTRMLHCLHPAGFLSTSFIIDVSKTGSHSISAPSTTDAYGVGTKFAHWIGLVSIPEDKLARARRDKNERATSAGQDPIVSPEIQPVPDPLLVIKTLEALVGEMNSSDDARVFKVAESTDILMLGDVQLSKDGLDFELSITSLKPGRWHVSEVSETEVLLTWIDPISEQHVHSQGERHAAVQTNEWEELGSFSVDGGVAGAFLASAFEDGGALHGVGGDVDSAVMLETLMDHLLDSDSRVLAVPGGAVFSGDDGGYRVEGRRDADGSGELVAIKVR